jgi:hypothetical protein
MKNACLAGLIAAALAAGCSSGGSPDSGAITSCADPVLEVYFDPMYSAYDGVHPFQIPAIVSGVSSGAIQWYASDPSMVQLTPDPTLGGVIATTKASGTVQILPSAGGLCGESLLTITANTPEDWDAGYARYNLAPMPPPDAGLGAIFGPQNDGGAYIACAYCHGATATSGLFKDIAHTPEQAGGFSDAQLTNIITEGEVPGWSCNHDGGGHGGYGGEYDSSTGDAGYFDDSIVSYCEWTNFHHWPMQSPEQLTGVICYLRSLTPTPQNGSADFGGHGPGGPHGPTGGHGGSGGFGGSNGGSGGGTTG